MLWQRKHSVILERNLVRRRGVKKNGGKVRLRSHVDRILIEGGRAAGVVLKGGQMIRAAKAVVSNASMWDTIGLLPEEHVPPSYRKQARLPAQLPGRAPTPLQKPSAVLGPLQARATAACRYRCFQAAVQQYRRLDMTQMLAPAHAHAPPPASRNSCNLGWRGASVVAYRLKLRLSTAPSCTCTWASTALVRLC